MMQAPLVCLSALLGIAAVWPALGTESDASRILMWEALESSPGAREAQQRYSEYTPDTRVRTKNQVLLEVDQRALLRWVTAAVNAREPIGRFQINREQQCTPIRLEVKVLSDGFVLIGGRCLENDELRLRVAVDHSGMILNLHLSSISGRVSVVRTEEPRFYVSFESAGVAVQDE